MIFGCTTFIQSYKVTSWGVNIFRDSRLCWSSFVICWKELTWTSIPKSKSLPDRLENNNDADDEKVIGKEKKVTRKWIYMESFDMIFFHLVPRSLWFTHLVDTRQNPAAVLAKHSNKPCEPLSTPSSSLHIPQWKLKCSQYWAEARWNWIAWLQRKIKYDNNLRKSK